MAIVSRRRCVAQASTDRNGVSRKAENDETGKMRVFVGERLVDLVLLNHRWSM